MQTFVVDASVGAKWYFEEESQDIALTLLARAKNKEIKLIVPGLFYLEVGNICWKRFRRRIIQFDDAVAVLDKISRLPMERHSDHELAAAALENAIRFDIPIYDGIYVALAEVYVAPLVTADEGILRATKGRFDFVLPLREFQNRA